MAAASSACSGILGRWIPMALNTILLYIRPAVYTKAHAIILQRYPAAVEKSFIDFTFPAPEFRNSIHILFHLYKVLCVSKFIIYVFLLSVKQKIYIFIAFNYKNEICPALSGEVLPPQRDKLSDNSFSHHEL